MSKEKVTLPRKARVTNKGQITIPREVRQLLGVRPGDAVLFESSENGVHVRPLRGEKSFREVPGDRKSGPAVRPEADLEVHPRIAGQVTSALDTNVLVALWDSDDSFSRDAQAALDEALAQGNLVVPAPVFAELLAFPKRTDGFLQAFFRETGIAVDWNLSESVWKAAGRASGVCGAAHATS